MVATDAVALSHWQGLGGTDSEWRYLTEQVQCLINRAGTAEGFVDLDVNSSRE